MRTVAISHSLRPRGNMASEGSDSDDSGFDDGLSTDELLLARIAKMRDMINLTAATAAQVKDGMEKEKLKEKEKEKEKEKKGEEKEREHEAEDGEFLIVDKVHALALSREVEREQGEEEKREKEEQVEAEAAVEVKPVQTAPLVHDEAEEEEEEEEEEDDEAYAVTWNGGQLGLLFKAGARGETIIRRVNKKSSSAEGISIARAGDVLVSINGETVRGRALQDIVELLRLPVFPVALEFHPHKVEDDDGDDEHHVVRASEALHRKQSSVSATSSESVSTSIGQTSGPTGDRGAAVAHRLNHFGNNSTPTPFCQPTLYSPNDDMPEPDEYDVMWRQGTLGCGLKQRNGVPTIKSVTPGAAVDPSVQQIAPGDVMLQINGMRTDVIGFRAVVETMQRAPKPVYMRFRRGNGEFPPRERKASFPAPAPAQAPPSYMPPPRASNDLENLRESRVDMEDILAGSLGPRQYTVLWEHGPLGVQIKARSGDGAVVVSKFTGTGDPALCAQIQIGDVFVRIAGVEIANLGISGAYELLKSVHKPVVLVFERSSTQSETPAPQTHEDPRESAVPSFRLLREQQAQQEQQRRARESFSGFSPEQRGETVFGAAGRRALHAKQRPASYDTIGDHEERRSDLLGPVRHSSYGVNYSDGEPPRFHERCSDGSYPSAGNPGETDPLLPRFSDIEMGRVKTMNVSSLPPPPAYSDVFTQSGRALDPRLVMTPQRVPSSPRSGSRQSGSFSSGQAPNSHNLAQGPGYGVPGDSTPPPPPYPSRSTLVSQLNMSMTPYTQPPPSYDQHLGEPRSNQRIDQLRQQYIEAERIRNLQPPQIRDPSYTEVSSYSDLDDSGVMAAYRHQRNITPPPMPSLPAYSAGLAPRRSFGGIPSPSKNLPPPELWIQWSEGPLGITFRRTNGQIVVSRLTGAGYSRGLDQLRPGDWLVSFGSAGVGSYATNDLRLSETMELIKTLPKPVDLCFVVQ